MRRIIADIEIVPGIESEETSLEVLQHVVDDMLADMGNRSAFRIRGSKILTLPSNVEESDPALDRHEWQEAVCTGDTSQGYWEWVDQQKELAEIYRAEEREEYGGLIERGET